MHELRRNVPEPCDEAESDDTGAWIVPYVIPSTRYGDETTSTAEQRRNRCRFDADASVNSPSAAFVDHDGIAIDFRD